MPRPYTTAKTRALVAQMSAILQNSTVTTQLGVPRPQHRHRLFRRMVLTKEKPILAMASWQIKLQHDNSFRRWWKSDLIGMSLAGMSDLEYEVMVTWCWHNGATYISRKRRFDDFVHHSFTDQILNLPEDVPDITYMENEVVVIGSEEFINDALRFSKRWPTRSHVCYVKGMPIKSIRDYMRDSNHRICQNLSDPDAYLVSCDDKDKLFTLWLHG